MPRVPVPVEQKHVLHVCRTGRFALSSLAQAIRAACVRSANYLLTDSISTRLEMFFQCFRALCCKGPPPPRPEYDVVCIGLTGAGKSSLLSQLCSESADNIVPTTGFSIKAVPFQNAILNVKELGERAKNGTTIARFWEETKCASCSTIAGLDVLLIHRYICAQIITVNKYWTSKI
ncbi:hypothetical protein NDU88_005371 [Pleurodeles waltl]|uniref:G domain-containing protein n=1 Tax=Pleurodeles waltl TaxID=8319 RepID=A0AAV7WBL8_PLEWA|nr:hypothetical protein NDU88_005371 [Pleurodeles waltl]